VAYFDSGGGVNTADGLLWLQTTADYKNAGISVLAEGATDAQMWISGSALQFPYGAINGADYSMLNAILPGAVIFGFTQGDDMVGNDRWWTVAINNGHIPLLSNRTVDGDNTHNQMQMWQDDL
jgi:hypothetical protein